MRHVVFGLLVCLFAVVWSQNWTWFASALLIAAWVKHRGNLTARLEAP